LESLLEVNRPYVPDRKIPSMVRRGRLRKRIAPVRSNGGRALRTPGSTIRRLRT